MARIRTIKPDFFVSESIGELSLHARLTFIGLWTYVDDDGRAKDNPRAIRGALWPNDEETVSSADVARFIDELEQKGMVCRYTVGGTNYLHVVNMRKHQAINKATKSKLPECPTYAALAAKHSADEEVTEDSRSTPGTLPDTSGSTTGGNGSGSGSGMEVEGEQAQAPKRGRPRTPATEAPEHFDITPNLAAWAASKGIADVATPEETERFLFHHRSKGNKFSNWDAAWQKWMSNQAKWAAERASPMPPPRQNRAFANAGSTGAFDEPL